MTNEQVIYAFVKKQSAETTNVSTDRKILWSYDSVLAQWTDNNWIIIHGSIAQYSNTSRQHTSILRSALSDHNKQMYWFNNNTKTLEYSYLLTLIDIINKYKRARTNKANYEKRFKILKNDLLNYLNDNTFEPGYKTRVKNYIKKIEYQFNCQTIWNKQVDQKLLDKIQESLIK